MDKVSKERKLPETESPRVSASVSPGRWYLLRWSKEEALEASSWLCTFGSRACELLSRTHRFRVRCKIYSLQSHLGKVATGQQWLLGVFMGQSLSRDGGPRSPGRRKEESMQSHEEPGWEEMGRASEWDKHQPPSASSSSKRKGKSMSSSKWTLKTPDRGTRQVPAPSRSACSGASHLDTETYFVMKKSAVFTFQNVSN